MVELEVTDVDKVEAETLGPHAGFDLFVQRVPTDPFHAGLRRLVFQVLTVDRKLGAGVDFRDLTHRLGAHRRSRVGGTAE